MAVDTKESKKEETKAKEEQPKADEADPIGISAEPKAKSIEGAPGGPFVIKGENFGSRGVVTVGALPAFVSSWRDDRIKGGLPEGAKAGDAVAINGVPQLKL